MSGKKEKNLKEKWQNLDTSKKRKYQYLINFWEVLNFINHPENASLSNAITPNNQLSMGKQSYPIPLFYRPPHSLLLSTYKSCRSFTYLISKR